MLKDSQEFLLLLLNKLHEELKQVNRSDDTDQQSAHSEAEHCPSDTEHDARDLARGSDVVSLDEDDSSGHSSAADADDIVHLCC